VIAPRRVRARAARANRPGMTLLELVITLAIVAIMVTAGGSAFAHVIDREQTIRTASAEVERAAALREMLHQWIAEGDIQIQQGGGPRGTTRTTTVGRQGTQTRTSSARASSAQAGVTAAVSTGNELAMTTSAPNPLMAQSVLLRIFVDADDNTPERGLTIEYQNAVSNLIGLQRRELDPTVGDLSVEFFDQRTGRWIASTEAATGGQLVAVRLTLIPADGVALPRLLSEPITYVFGEITP
jgi:prepilin-type N-terminal cleavage/methylation domain-containing protein